MRVLADENIPLAAVERLRSAGHDVVWALTHFHGWKDMDLLEAAEAEGLLLLTLDRDFWQIAAQRRAPLKRSGVTLFRVHPATPANLAPLVEALLRAERSWTGHISMVTPAGIQMLARQTDGPPRP